MSTLNQLFMTVISLNVLHLTVQDLKQVQLHSTFNLNDEQLRQLICLARALIKGSKIVMMDEATANVDNQTDNLIQEMVSTSFPESTVLVIAHRLRTIVDSDLIVVMEGGKCVEFGSPRELVGEEGSVFNDYIDHTGVEEAHYLRERIQRIVT